MLGKKRSLLKENVHHIHFKRQTDGQTNILKYLLLYTTDLQCTYVTIITKTIYEIHYKRTNGQSPIGEEICVKMYI